MSPAAVFNTVLNCIKVGDIVPTTTAATVEEDTSTNTSTSSSTRHTRMTSTSVSSTGPTTKPTVTDTADEVLANMGKPYTQVLLFLWALHHIEAEIKAPTIATLQDNGTIA